MPWSAPEMIAKGAPEGRAAKAARIANRILAACGCNEPKAKKRKGRKGRKPISCEGLAIATALKRVKQGVQRQ